MLLAETPRQNTKLVVLANLEVLHWTSGSWTIERILLWKLEHAIGAARLAMRGVDHCDVSLNLTGYVSHNPTDPSPTNNWDVGVL